MTSEAAAWKARAEAMIYRGWVPYQKDGLWYVRPLHGTRMFKGYASAVEALDAALLTGVV